MTGLTIPGGGGGMAVSEEMDTAAECRPDSVQERGHSEVGWNVLFTARAGWIFKRVGSVFLCLSSPSDIVTSQKPTPLTFKRGHFYGQFYCGLHPDQRLKLQHFDSFCTINIWFNFASSNSGCIRQMTGWHWIMARTGRGRNRSWAHLRHCSAIHLEGLRKTTMNVINLRWELRFSM
jgi:hypothetical protein